MTHQSEEAHQKPFTSRVKVVVVCMLDSVHSARWLAQFVDDDIDFQLFASTPHRKVHDQIATLLRNDSQARYSISLRSKYLWIGLWLVDRILDDAVRAFLLRKLVNRSNPHYVHAMEFQNAGYICLKAFEKHELRGAHLISSNWGSDIYWFSRFPRHRRKIERLLSITDFYSAECIRDVGLARDLGYNGKVKKITPNSGVFTKRDLSVQLTPFNERKTIAVKGYQSWAGRAKLAMRAIEELKDELHGCEIIVFSCNRSIVRLSKKISIRTGLSIKTHKKGSLPREDVLKILAKSKIYLGVSKTDGISTSMLEAMAMGAIPVQTNTSCCDEWFTNSGVAIDSISVESIKSSILKGLEISGQTKNQVLNRNEIVSRVSSTSFAEDFYSK